MSSFLETELKDLFCAGHLAIGGGRKKTKPKPKKELMKFCFLTNPKFFPQKGNFT